MKRSIWYVAALSALSVAGCWGSTAPQQISQPPSETGEKTVALAELTENQKVQQQVALAARDALFQQLLGRLTMVLTEKGPAAAIQVCKTDAPRLAGEVGQQFGVAIGRTSHRLRNPENAPREWSRPLVEQHVAEPQFVALEDGRLGALLPIRLKPACVLCHGAKDQIPAEVQAALVSHYPEDQATGFKEDDLRGWFWVEVPADAKLPESPATEATTE